MVFNRSMLSLEEISDRLEIQQLLVAYSTAIDTRQFDDLAQVFTPDAYIDYLRACPPQPGFDAVRYPGEYEAAQRARHADAIELDTATAAALRQLADGAGVPFPVLG